MASERKEVDAQVRRGGRDDFKAVEASRPPWDDSAPFHYTQTPAPSWTFGSGANYTHAQASASAATATHVAIDPNDGARTRYENYKLLVSAVTPRPIAFVSTRSRDGRSENLAPMSFFQLVNVDPPIFALAVTSPMADAKDTLRNLLDTGECVINMVSEGFVEAMNATSINSPFGVSEWDISGWTPVYDCKTVAAPRVRESVFSIEGKLESVRDFASRRNPGARSGSLELIEGTHFWVREDAFKDDGTSLDLEVRSHGLPCPVLSFSFDFNRGSPIN
jgi:flavin reductase (DIM6/NTAB) family NADH-FMN oxidoreductase RutF